jgi:hypothetical protein
VDTVRGRTEDARGRYEAMERTFDTRSDILAPYFAELHIWEGAPDRALAGLDRAFSAESHREFLGETGRCMALAVRAAADVAAREKAGVERREALAEQVLTLHSAAHQDPFDAQAVPADRLHAAQWAAELARLEGSDTIELWIGAAAEWDAASRPHDVAYCRWRAAEVALRTGQATAATKLLRSAAGSARQHVPLAAAIVNTSAHALARART